MKQKKPAPKQLPPPPRADVDALLALYNLRRYAEAENRTRALLEKYPEFGFGWKLLGGILQMQGRDALPAYQKAAQFLPDDPHAHYNVGVALKRAGRIEDAAASYRKAIALKSDFAEAHSNLGNALKDLGRFEDAVASYLRAIKIRPDSADTHVSLGIVLNGLGRLEEAAASYRKAAEIKPDFALAYYNLGNTQKDMGRFNEAVASYRRAVEIKPDIAEAHNNLGGVLKDMGRLDDALASYRTALALKPDIAETHNNLGSVFKDLGQIDAALASYRRALELKPDFAEAYSNLLFLYGYQGLIAPDEYLVQARNWEQACVPARERQEARHRDFRRPPLAGRRLRVGYVSGDFRQHAVSYFVEQLFTHHDRSRIELFAYSTQNMRDAVTDRLQALAEHWVQFAGGSDDAIRARIAADDIDVLIDLSGHSAHNRLGMFARRAAPVQAHYLGYFASTGLTEMDYWIGDEILTPAATDKHFCEQVWRLPRVWVSYESQADAPVPDWHPDKDGIIWVGSFNNLAKLTPATLALWAKVLQALPEGRLLLKTKELAEEGNRHRILDAMADHGIAPERIELQDRSVTPDWSAHMGYYNRLDIALDPVGGVGGGTTTCDALWMGVPVITLEGDRMAARMTASMLNAIGHPEWIARTETEYIDKVVAFARDSQQRNALRFTQRERMAQSPLCDAADLAACLENAYVGMSEQWQKKQKARPPIVGEKNVVFIGDSITKGTCFSTSEFYTAFTARAEHGLPIACPSYIWNIYNEGVDGSCTRDWVGWLDSRVIAHNPTDVLICLGINDSADNIFPYHVSPADFQENLQSIISKIRAHSPATNIVLVNIPLINLNKRTWERTDPYRVQYRGIIQSVAEANDCKVVDVFSELEQLSNQAVFDSYYFSNDGIHLSDISHALIYDALMHVLGGRN